MFSNYFIKLDSIAYNDYEIVADNLLNSTQRSVKDRITAYGLFIDPPLGRVGMPEECATVIAFLASEAASFIVGGSPAFSRAEALAQKPGCRQGRPPRSGGDAAPRGNHGRLGRGLDEADIGAGRQDRVELRLAQSDAGEQAGLPDGPVQRHGRPAPARRRA